MPPEFQSRDREGAGAPAPLTLAQARVDEACRLLQRGSGFAIESCLPLLQDARRILAESSGALRHNISAAPSLAASLGRAGDLAHTAASFYRECLWLTSADSRAYTALGVPGAAPPPNRTLLEA
jgi:hypothetical protein